MAQEFRNEQIATFITPSLLEKLEEEARRQYTTVPDMVADMLERVYRPVLEG